MKNLLSVLSQNEIKMFNDLGWGYLLDIFKEDEVMPLYRMAVEKAFAHLELDKPISENINALRALQKAILHLTEGKFRSNDEFENLIDYN